MATTAFSSWGERSSHGSRGLSAPEHSEHVLTGYKHRQGSLSRESIPNSVAGSVGEQEQHTRSTTQSNRPLLSQVFKTRAK